MMTITNCPVCNSENLQKDITCKDFLVSGEDFNLSVCMICQFKFTNPRPLDSELGKYYKSEKYISHTNTKQGIVSRLYHLVRNYTLKKKVKLVSRYVSRGTLLDYGCGTGMFLNAARGAGFTCYGIEPDDGARNMASQMDLNVVADKSQLPSDVEFDLITMWHVLEHVSDLNATIELLRSRLKKEGTLIIAVPNYRSFDAEHYGPHWAAYDVPRHLYHFDKTSIRNLLANHSFQLLTTLPMIFDSYYVSMLSEKYKYGKTNYLRAFRNGFRSNLRASSSWGYSSVIYVFKKQ